MSLFTLQAISPTWVDTGFIVTAGMSQQESRQLYQEQPFVRADDVTESIVHVLSAPPHVQVRFLLSTSSTLNLFLQVAGTAAQTVIKGYNAT